MRSLAEILASPERPPMFANGTEFYAWMANWCDRCAHDAAFQKDESPEGCPLLLAHFSGVVPSEWMEQAPDENGLYRLGDNCHCIEYRNEDDGPAGPTGPIPDPPGQELLLPREPFEGVRMLTTYPTSSRDTVSVPMPTGRYL